MSFTRLWNKCNTTLKIVVVASLLGIVCYQLSNTVTVSRLAHAQVVATPFTLEMKHYRFDGDVAGEVFSVGTIVRRSDGSTASIQSLGPINLGMTARRVVFMDGRSVTLADLVASKMSGRMPEHEVAALKLRLQSPHPQCVVNRFQAVVDSTVLFGQQVFAVQSETPITRLTAWNAPALGCQALRYRYERKNDNGTFTLASEARAERFVIGEPDPSLFNNNTGYTERRPSDVQRLLFDKIGAAVPTDEQSLQVQKKLDEKYLREQRR